jgi:hypothetical protein
MELTTHAIELHSLDIRSNRRRRYQVVLALDPTRQKPHTVTMVWGRYGWKTRTLLFSAEDPDTALQYVKSVLTKRSAHGYQISHVDEAHPLTEWLHELDMEIETLPDLQMRLFPGAIDFAPPPESAQLTLFS